jgi:hypothetical protein
VRAFQPRSRCKHLPVFAGIEYRQNIGNIIRNYESALARLSGIGEEGREGGEEGGREGGGEGREGGKEEGREGGRKERDL